MITLHDYERRPLADPGVNIKVEITNPVGQKLRAQVMDLTNSEGAYKVMFQVMVKLNKANNQALNDKL